MCLIMETYKDEIMKLSGRSMQSINRWCRFETSETDDLKSIKAVVKKKNKEAVLCFFLKRKNNDIKNGSEFTDPLFPCHCFR